MKKSLKFFTIVVSLLLTSAFLLGCGMHAIGRDYGESKPYNLDSLSNVVSVDVADSSLTPIETDDFPQTQEGLKEKFMQYIHAENNVATVFSDEQYAELKAIRERGERIPLTYDEVLFLINDSINLYFKYDRIRLTNAVADEISHKSYLNTITEVIETYHGDFTEFVNYDLAYRRYEKMLEDIYSVIYYRIYVHDAGFASVNEGADGDKKVQLLSLNGGLSSGADNDALLSSEWEKIANMRKWYYYNSIPPESLNPQPLTAPLLFTYHSSESLRYQLYINSPNWKQTKVFPTNELTELMPTATSIYIAGDGDENWGRPYITLNEQKGRLYMYIPHLSSYTLCGDYDDHDGVLKFYPESIDGSAPKTYSYVFHYEDGAWVYSRENSDPNQNADIKDGLRFKLYEENVYMPHSKKPIASIKNYAEINEIATAEELERFYEDEKYVYSFPSILSEYIIVTFTDGTEMPVKEALFKGYIDISDLDKYSIQYYKDLRK